MRRSSLGAARLMWGSGARLMWGSAARLMWGSAALLIWGSAALLMWGCAAALPPERLVGVDAELARAETLELAETQPSVVGEARQRRDAAWKAFRAGDAEYAELNAWIAWQRLRVAENLEAIGKASAVATANQAAKVDTTPTSSGPTATAPAVAAGGGPAGDNGRRTANSASASPPGRADRAVQDAEDARLRLIVSGAQSDWRWPEGEALLQTAQRALERGSYDRAEQLADRALFVFEMVRLSQPAGDSGPTDALGDGATTRRRSGRDVPAPSKAFVNESVRVTRFKPQGESLGCTKDVEAAEALLREAEQRRLGGDPGGAEVKVTIAGERLSRCDAAFTRQTALRITPLREEATLASRKTASASDRSRSTRLVKEADRAVSDGDLATAELLLLEAVGRVAPAAPAPPEKASTAATAPSEPTTPTATPPKANAGGGSPAPAAAVPRERVEPAIKPPAVGAAPAVIAPTLGVAIPVGNSRRPEAASERRGDAAQSDPAPAPTGPGRSRIASDRLEPLSPATEVPATPPPSAPAPAAPTPKTEPAPARGEPPTAPPTEAPTEPPTQTPTDAPHPPSERP